MYSRYSVYAGIHKRRERENRKWNRKRRGKREKNSFIFLSLNTQNGTATQVESACISSARKQDQSVSFKKQNKKGYRFTVYINLCLHILKKLHETKLSECYFLPYNNNLKNKQKKTTTLLLTYKRYKNRQHVVDQWLESWLTDKKKKKDRQNQKMTRKITYE